MALAGFGIVALLGTAPGLGAGPPTVEARLSGLAGAVAVAVCTSTLAQAWVVVPAGYYGATIARVGAVSVGAVAALAVIAAFHLFHGRPAHDRLWAAAGLPDAVFAIDSNELLRISGGHAADLAEDR